MTIVPLHELGTAPEEARPVLEEIKRKWGALSPAFATLASNPAILKAQWAKHEVVMRPHEMVTPLHKQAIALAVSAFNHCSYCAWAHARAAQRLGLSDEETALVKGGSATTEPLRTLVQMAHQVAADATRVDGGVFAELRRHGFADADIIEAVAVAAYFNEMNRLLDALGVEAPSIVPGAP